MSRCVVHKSLDIGNIGTGLVSEVKHFLEVLRSRLEEKLFFLGQGNARVF